MLHQDESLIWHSSMHKSSAEVTLYRLVLKTEIS